MITKEVTVKNPTGLHARPATLLVKRASTYKSDVSIEFNGKKANVKSLIGVLSLGVVKGSIIKVVTSGEDEEKAAEELASLIENLEE
ncbi:HPr family phosphocarrier protein [Proteiniclasticum sp. QWL-01]|uniref:HPr family phosphocarrier protein n=1 Tax=Proteiniclasticum sp. QWL-01 TaxID=3036945 RepID=UPI0021FB1094|nr:HPr family phosphocarrier protein [Proteiniclasticum sp. QWL-01]UUM13084.1 HPr family phosphocarrier protein [Clostridiaceae bacterium HFYG-1003]WFF71509.1 HPr family phosphocarrier protein [Proteiniclasticum sp. QWL-01]